VEEGVVASKVDVAQGGLRDTLRRERRKEAAQDVCPSGASCDHHR
jgi:hypothetical protein